MRYNGLTDYEASGGRLARRGMTLIEITVTLTIIALLLAVVIPNLAPFRTRVHLRTSARNLAALIRYARNKAIYSHRTVKLRIDVEHAQYRLDLMIDSVPANRREKDKLRMVEALRTLPEKVYLDRVILYDRRQKSSDKVVVLDFTPRGTVTPATIVLADAAGRHMTLDIFGTTGAVEVYKGTPPEPAPKEVASK